MKERFEDLSAWREKQREERGFLESRLEEARSRINTLTMENLDLRKQLERAGGEGGAQEGSQVRRSPYLFCSLCLNVPRTR